MKKEIKNKQEPIMWAYQRLDYDQWAISSINGEMVSYKGTIKNWFTKEGLRMMGYKVGKKLEKQKYSDMTAYQLSPLTPISR